MKVIQLTTVDMSLELLLGPQLDAIRDEGFEVIGVSAPGPWVDQLEARGIRHLPLSSSTRGWNLRADLRAARDLWRILRTERPVVLHTHNPKPGLYGRVLGRFARVPIVVNTLHGLYAAPDDLLAKRLIVYAMEAAASRFSDAELIQSSEDLALMRRWAIAPRHKLIHLGNGIDLARFDPDSIDPDDLDRLRLELGLDPGLPVLGMVGRLVAEKGWQQLFDAVALLANSGRRLQVVAIGPEDPDKVDAIPRHDLDEAEAMGVRFLGLRHDMPLLYALMDLFCLPSHREGFPRGPMEAAAMGVPVVASDIRGCREVVGDGETGLLVPVGDPSALAAAMGTLLDDPGLRSEMGREARKRAVERFDVTTVAELVLATYARVAGRKGLSLQPSASLRPALPTEASAIAQLHIESITTGFLASLGLRPLSALYEGLIADPRSLVLVSVDKGGSPIGFIAGSRHVGRTYRRVLARHGWRIALAALPAFIRSPSRIGKAFETVRYPGSDDASLPEAELLSMAVSEGRRSTGVGETLVGGLLNELAAPAVRVVVGMDNAGARRFYRRVGFEPVQQLSVHGEEPSEMLVWNSSSDS